MYDTSLPQAENNTVDTAIRKKKNRNSHVRDIFFFRLSYFVSGIQMPFEDMFVCLFVCLCIVAGRLREATRFATHWKLLDTCTSCNWTVRGSNSGGGEIFRTRPDRPWGLNSLLYNGYRVFPWGKAAGAWCWPPTPQTKRRGHERVGLYLYSLSGSSWPVIGATFTFTFLLVSNI